MSFEAPVNPGDIVEPGDALSYAAYCTTRATILDIYGFKGGSNVPGVTDEIGKELSTLEAENLGAHQRLVESIATSIQR